MQVLYPILAMFGVFIFAYLRERWMETLRLDAAQAFQFYPYLTFASLSILLLALLLVGLVVYLWSRNKEHRLAAVVFVLIGAVFVYLPHIRYTILGTYVTSLPDWLTHLSAAFAPTSPAGLTAGVVTGAGLLHLILKR
jgi:hypothetical protein